MEAQGIFMGTFPEPCTHPLWKRTRARPLMHKTQGSGSKEGTASPNGMILYLVSASYFTHSVTLYRSLCMPQFVLSFLFLIFKRFVLS